MLPRYFGLRFGLLEIIVPSIAFSFGNSTTVKELLVFAEFITRAIYRRHSIKGRIYRGDQHKTGMGRQKSDELNLRQKMDSTLQPSKRGKGVNINVDPEQALDGQTMLIVITNPAKLEKIK